MDDTLTTERVRQSLKEAILEARLGRRAAEHRGDRITTVRYSDLLIALNSATRAAKAI